jgi:hypothetical protein
LVKQERRPGRLTQVINKKKEGRPQTGDQAFPTGKAKEFLIARLTPYGTAFDALFFIKTVGALGAGRRTE